MNVHVLRQFSRLALRNVFRHRLRSALTLAAIAFGAMGLVLTGGFVEDIYAQLGEAIVHSQTGHLQVAPAGYFEAGAHTPEQYLIPDPRAVEARIAARPEVSQAMARLDFAGLLNNGRSDYPIVGVGVEPGKEAKLGTYVRIVSGRSLAGRDRYGMLIGAGVARALDLRVGDRATLVTTASGGAVNSLDFEVTGTFESFSKEYDDRAVQVPLAAAQELLDTPGANVVVVELKDTAATQAVAQDVRALLSGRKLEVRTWQELSDFYAKTVSLYDRQFAVLRLIVLLMVLLTVANTVNMSLYERTAEFGTMRALGNRSGRVFSLVLAEGAILGVIGAALGIAAGVLCALAASAIGIPMPPPPNSNLAYVARIRIVPSVIAAGAAVAVLASVLATMLPARRAMRLAIVDALRHSL